MHLLLAKPELLTAHAAAYGALAAEEGAAPAWRRGSGAGACACWAGSPAPARRHGVAPSPPFLPFAALRQQLALDWIVLNASSQQAPATPAAT